MNIALDYDDTYTKDPELWDSFVDAARERGHKVWIVTCRRNTEENRLDIGRPAGCVVFYSNLGPKLDYMKSLFLKVDVWIDDDPNCVLNGK